ncbi:hypothetical protein D3C76_1645350 [compost metagenome]
MSLADFPMVTLYDIRSKYETFQMEWVKPTMLDRLVRLCAQFQLMEPLDAEQRSDDARFKLFHTWMYVIQADEMKQLTERLERYQSEKKGGILDEMDEAATVD